jgi:tetratricopeptide (TPR) repeat protein
VKLALTVGVLVFAFAAYIAGAQELSVTYVDGDAQVRDGSAWAVLSIGDRLTPQATIQLSRGAYVEIKRGDTKIVLSQKGTYSLASLIASSRALGSAGVGKALLSSLSRLAAGPAHNQSDTAGMRGANETKSNESEWMTSSAQVFLDAGQQYLKSGQYAEAIEQFLQALDAATEQESPQVHYYLAYAYSLNSDTQAALKHAMDLQPSGGDEWASDFIILKAKLLIDSYAFGQVIAWLTQNGNDLSGDAQRGAIYEFLLGVGYRGVGDTANAKASLSKVVTMSSDSDLGKAATQLLQNP